MTNWVFIAVAGYFLSAVSKILDKVLLARVVPQPIVYTFYGGLLSGLVIVLFPFGFAFIPIKIFFIALCAGAFFVVSLFFLYRALKENDASRVVPLIVGIGPFITLALSVVVFGESFGGYLLYSFLFLVVGGVLLSIRPAGYGRLQKQLLIDSCVASAAMSANIILTKAVFLQTSFINGVIWTRIGIFLTALMLLALPRLRMYLKKHHTIHQSGASLFLGNKIIGASGLFLVGYAIAKGSPAFVHAFGSFEYFFVFILGFFVTMYAPRLLKEDISPRALLFKIFGATLLVIALLLLSVV
jgi:drug/metabolite transporter (DMT)-like permease